MSVAAVGTPNAVDHADEIVAEQGQTGFIVFGPYELYEPGKYYVSFSVLPVGTAASDANDLVAVVDVASDEGRSVLARSNVFRQRAVATGGGIVLPFEVRVAAKLEFRVQSTGRAKLVIDRGRPVMADERGFADFCPMLKLGEQPQSLIIRQHLDSLRYIYEKGIDWRVRDNYIAVELSGLDLSIRNAEDFQVLDEVFIRNDYNYQISRDHIVIDVGMNVGFASLFFASNRGARKVYSFEPFAQPFAQAQRNFARNPLIANKIVAHQIGLSDHDANTEVGTVDGFTLGMTLKGVSHGTPEPIRVRNAADMLGGLIEEAGRHGWAVVLKLDCEGSEFPIFTSLAAYGLLERFDVIMMEWHKEWSPALAQHDLIRPLMERGFVVFDQTEESKHLTGMLYAVRASH